MAQLSISLLGSPIVIHGEQPLSFATHKVQALLIYLAVEEGMHPRQKLATLLWPESDRAAARASLRNTLLRLRRVLQHSPHVPTAPHLLVERNALGFNPDAAFTLDLHIVAEAVDLGTTSSPPLSSEILDRLQTATDLLRGDFLEGFTLPDAPAFDDWASFQREQWHLRAGALFDALSRAQSEQGQTRAAIATVQRWLAFDPLNERIYRRLMRLQLAYGDRAGAQKSYEACCAMLESELDASPAPETQAFAARLQEPPASPSRPVPSAPDPHNLPVLQLVGRGPEHAHLVDLFRHTRGGEATIAIVEGEAGIGKTRLATAFLAWASAQGATILYGKAFESGGRLSYQPLVEMLRPLVSRGVGTQGDKEQDASTSAVISPLWLAELSRILPELREARPDLPIPTPDERTAQGRLFEAVARLLQRTAKASPLVFFLDDVQWSDSATLDLLHYACHRWQKTHTSILCILAVRSEALASVGGQPLHPTLAVWLAELARDLSPARLRLGPLTEAETAEVVAQLVGENGGGLAEWLYDQTAGQPFYLVETLEALLEEGVLQTRRSEDGWRLTVVDESLLVQNRDFVPPGVREVVRRRLARLSPTGFQILAAGAVLGQSFAFRDLWIVSDVDAEEILSALDEVVGARLLVEQTGRVGQPYTFAHDKIRDVVYTEAGDARRHIFHRRAFHHLEENAAPPARLAHHALAAGLTVPAFRCSLAAGDAAMAVFAMQDAIGHYEQARRLLVEFPHLGKQIVLDQRQHLLEQLGRAYELTTEWAQAGAIYQSMLDLAEQQRAATMKVAALNRLGSLEISQALNVEQSKQWHNRARTLAKRIGDRTGLAEAMRGLAQASHYSAEPEKAIAYGKQALALARKLEDNEKVARCLNVLAYATHGAAPLETVTVSRAYAAEGRQLFTALGNRPMAADCLTMVGIAYIHEGKPRDAIPQLEEAHEMAHESENRWGQVNSGFNLAIALREAGRYGEALATAERTVALAQEHEIGLLPNAWMSQGIIYRSLGKVEEARRSHEEAAAKMAVSPNPAAGCIFATELCADHVHLSDWEKALRLAEKSLACPEQYLFFSGFVYWAVVQALLHSGDTAHAHQATTSFQGAIGDNPRYCIVLYRCRALLAEYQGHVKEAISHLRTALATSETLDLPVEQWQLHNALADLYASAGDGSQADAARSQAQEIRFALAETLPPGELRTHLLSLAE